jgi:hypothetical protein
VVGKAEMPLGFLERRIDDGIFDQISHALAHGARWRDQARFWFEYVHDFFPLLTLLRLNGRLPSPLRHDPPDHRRLFRRYPALHMHQPLRFQALPVTLLFFGMTAHTELP